MPHYIFICRPHFSFLFLIHCIKALNNPEKLGVWNDVANSVKSESEKLVAVIDSIRFKIQQEAGLKEGTNELEALDDKEVTIKVLVKTVEDKGFGYGQLLKAARDQYREFLLSLDSLLQTAFLSS